MDAAGARLLLWIIAPMFLAAATGAQEVPEHPGVTVVIANLRSGDGQVRIALWNDPDSFATEGTALAEDSREARPGDMRFTFQGLPPGRYGVVGYHDENGNGTFDQTWIGLPDEGLGFSNGAWIGFGAPSFEEAAVEITRSQPVIVVKLRYPGGAPAPAAAESRDRYR